MSLNINKSYGAILAAARQGRFIAYGDVRYRGTPGKVLLRNPEAALGGRNIGFDQRTTSTIWPEILDLAGAT